MPATTAACFGTPPPGSPRELPRGYRFLWTIPGPYVGERAKGEQETSVYNRSCSDPDAPYPVLVIRVRSATGTLEPPIVIQGRVEPLGGRGLTAVYSDGSVGQDLRKILCRGEAQPTTPDWWTQRRCRWEAPEVNALVVDEPGEAFAILGSKQNGIRREELVRIAQRLSLRAPRARGGTDG